MYAIQLIFTKFGENVAHGPQKKPLDFVDNPSPVRKFYLFGPWPYSGWMAYV